MVQESVVKERCHPSDDITNITYNEAETLKTQLALQDNVAKETVAFNGRTGLGRR
jgi:hypothetical protein